MAVVQFPSTPSKNFTVSPKANKLEASELHNALQQFELHELQSMEKALTEIDTRLRLAEPSVQQTLQSAEAILKQLEENLTGSLVDAI